MSAGGIANDNFSTRAAARILAVPPERIRYWVRRRFISPSALRGRRYRFAFKDLLVMRLAKELLPSRHHLEPVQRTFERVRSLVGPSRPVSSLKLENLDGRIVVRDGSVCFEADSGQLILDFERRTRPGSVDQRFAAERARERFDEARRMAEQEPLRALSVYSNLLTHGPANLESHMHLADILEDKGDLDGALRHLIRATAMAPTHAEAHLKLGLVYRKLGVFDSAIRALLQAVECDPVLIAAHRNLSELYEETDRPHEALRHLNAIRRLLKGAD